MLTRNISVFIRASTFLSRIFPMCPFDKRLRITKLGTVLALACLAAGGYSAQRLHDMEEQTLKNNLISLMILTQPIACLALSFGYFSNYKNIKFILNELLKLSKTFKNEGISFHYNVGKIVKFDLMCYAVTSVEVIAISTSSAYTREAWLINVSLNAPYLLSHVIRTPLKSFLQICDSHFDAILESLKITTRIDKYQAQRIIYNCKLHKKLNGICKHLNKTFNFHFVTLSIQLFFLVVLTLFALTDFNVNMAHGDKVDWVILLSVDIAHILYLVLWVMEIIYEATICSIISAKEIVRVEVCYTLSSYGLFWPCCSHYTIILFLYGIDFQNLTYLLQLTNNQKPLSKSQQFNIILHDLFINDETGLIYENTFINNHLKKQDHVVFTAAGFLKFDFEMLHSVFAACTTYFIVLMQFLSIANPVVLHRYQEDELITDPNRNNS